MPPFVITIPQRDAKGATRRSIVIRATNLDSPYYAHVAIDESGPQGGYYPGPVFYHRADLDALIDTLTAARDEAFPVPA
jgi:hypothetical protein